MGCDVLYIFRGGGHGGDAMMTLRLAAAVQARGYSVRVMVSSGELHPEMFIANAKQLGVPCDIVDYFAEKPRWSRQKMFANLAKYLFKWSPRVVHLHTGNAFVNASLAACLAAFVRGRRIVTLHGAEPARPDEERSWRYVQRLFHRFIYPSEHERIRQSGLIPRVATHGETIGNLVAIPSKDIDRQAARVELGLTGGVVVLYCARLDPIKRPLWAIQAFEEIAAENPKAVLVVAGDGDQRQECEAAVAALGDRGRFLGFRKDVDRLLSTADIYVLPTRAENLSLGILEAMAAGLTIVSTDIPGVTEAVGDTGIICKVDSQDSLTTGLRIAVSDESVRLDLSHRAKDRFRSRFAPSIILDRHLAAYRVPSTSVVSNMKYSDEQESTQPV